jgi:hypothetical protein
MVHLAATVYIPIAHPLVWRHKSANHLRNPGEHSRPQAYGHPGHSSTGVKVRLHMVGKKTAVLVDKVMRRVPLSRSIYSITKNISDTFLSENRDLGMREMVKVLPDVYALGSWHVDLLLETEAATSSKLLNLFVPTSPNPATTNRYHGFRRSG